MFQRKADCFKISFLLGSSQLIVAEEIQKHKTNFLCASDISISLCLIEAKNLPSCLFNVVT